MRRTRALTLALGLMIGGPIALGAWSAMASTADSVEWDGFARWIRDLRATPLTVEAPGRIDLAAVPAGAGLALLDPQVDDPRGLPLFVKEGGRVLLAIEGPGAEPLLAAFGLQLAPAPGGDDVNHPALRALSTPGAGVFAGTDTLLANRPSALAGPLHIEAAVQYTDGTPFAYHLELGEGELLVVGDASLFINLMLDGADNSRFATNVGRWLGRGGQAPVWFAGPAATVGGRYGSGEDDDAPLAGLNEALGQIGRILDPDDLILHVLLAMAIAGTLVFAIAVFPGGGPPVTDGPVLPRSGRAERLAGRPAGPAAPEPPTESVPTDQTRSS